MRALPRSIRIFDWITCLDDALNYLLGDGDLVNAGLDGATTAARPAGC
jgi:hypothetical protein